MIKKIHCHVINCLILFVLGHLSVPGMIELAGASPLGTTYEAFLQIPIFVNPGKEEHFRDDVPFDTSPDIFPLDAGPGKDLRINENYPGDAGGGQETIEIVIFGPGAERDHSPLTDNEIDPDTPSILEVIGLYWMDATIGVDVTDIVLARSFDGGILFEDILPDDILFEEFEGTGTEEDPLNVFLEFSSDPLTLFDESIGTINATDLSLELTVQPVPIPGPLMLLISGFTGLWVVRRIFWTGNFINR